MPPYDQPSRPAKPPLASPVDAHTIRLRDLRNRFGEPEKWVAECTCGWRGNAHEGLNSDRSARRDGMRHCERAISRTPPVRDYYRQG